MQLADTVEYPLQHKICHNFADTDALGDARIDHPNNAKYRVPRPAYKRNEFLNDKGEDITDEILQKNFDKIIEDTHYSLARIQ